MTLNWVIGTETEWGHAQITPPITARRFMLDTPQGQQEVILQHVDIHADNFGQLVRGIPSVNFLSDSELQMILPVESEGTNV